MVATVRQNSVATSYYIKEDKKIATETIKSKFLVRSFTK